MKTINKKRITPILDYVYYDKQIMKYENACIGLGANSLQYGSSVFGGIRGYVNSNQQIQIFRLKDHYKRLITSAKIMSFDYTISYDEFKNIIFELIKINKITKDFYIRPFIFCDQTFIGPKLYPNSYDLAIYIQTLAANTSTTNGLNVMISSFVKYSDNSISTKSKVGGSYVNSMLAHNQAQVCGCDDALLFNQNGYLAEASVANVIIVKDNQIFIPETSDCALEGITLRTCMEILTYNNVTFHRKHIDRSTLYSADYILLTGTAMMITYIKQLDGRKISSDIGEVGKLLQNQYWKIINNEHDLSSQLLESYYEHK